MAGEGNLLYLLQDTTTGAVAGNSFSSDQSAASFSSIGTIETPATQLGDTNQADLTISGTGGSIALNQDNTSAAILGAALGNSAAISVLGGGAASVGQVGDHNLADLELIDGTGSISQNGNDNIAKLKLNAGVSGDIEQTGNTNVANLEVTGTASSSVTLIQSGGMSYTGSYSGGATSAPPITVYTNGTVTITQSPL